MPGKNVIDCHPGDPLLDKYMRIVLRFRNRVGAIETAQCRAGLVHSMKCQGAATVPAESNF